MFEDRSEAESIQRILDGSSWDEFCDMLKAAGAVVAREHGPASAFDRAEGYRYLSRLARAALETFVEHADPHAPELMRVVHETAKMGSDNPDNHYMNACISGAHEYRIVGHRGTVHYLGFGTQRGNYGEGAGMPPTGYLEAQDMEVEADGRFEIAVSSERRPGNWLPMEPETGTLIVRQTFLDREGETLARLRIERVDAPHRPEPVTPGLVDRGLSTVGSFVGGAAALFAGWAEDFQEHVNELPEFDRELSNRFGGDPNIVYYHSYWRLAPDEALVIEVTPPACDSWNFQLNNHWMESLDYRYFPIHVNKHSAVYESDGSVRIVVAHEDPQVANWVRTVGHDRGTMCFRWIRADEHPRPATRVAKIAALREEAAAR